MRHRDSAAHLYRTSVARIERGRVGNQISLSILQRSEAAVQRSQELLKQLPAQAEAPDVCAPRAAERQTKVVAPSELMERVCGQTFESQLVVLDGKHFVDCELNHCILEYSGSPMVLETTRSHHCSFSFGRTAAMTMRFAEYVSLIGEGAPEYEATSPGFFSGGRPN